MSKGRFGTAINCIDGRVQLPVLDWMRENYQLDYVDMITEPGPDGILASKSTDELESIRSRVMISLKAHGSELVVLASHHDCAGNPSSKEQHLAQNRKALGIMRSWGLPGVKYIGVWVNPDWRVELIEP